MKRIYIALLGIALLSVSCLKDLDKEGGPGKTDDSAIPSDFDWRMTRDIAVSVGMPTIDGAAPDYAVIRVYLDPSVVETNVVTKGVVSASSPSFRALMTIPGGLPYLMAQPR